MITMLVIPQIVTGAKLSLSTYELNPYIGSNLPNQGAIKEIVDKAFEASGYVIKVHFYPSLRAIHLAKLGKKTAVFPISYDDNLTDQIIFSDPLPGESLGLLRDINSKGEVLNITGKIIGVLRGRYSEVIRENYQGATYHEANSNEALLKMLFAGHIDFALIDKFTAADLMVDKLPHMIGRLEFIQSTLTPINFYVGFSKNKLHSQILVTKFNSGLKKIKENGTLNNILYNHGLLAFKTNKIKKTLRIATVSNAEMVTMQQMSSQFEYEHPDIKLEWRVIEESILRRRLLSDLAISDGLYDIMTIGSYEAPIWAKNEWLIPLVGLKDSYDKNDLLKEVRDSLSYNNKIYALPFYAESSMTFYRKDLFKKAGINMPASPTWYQIKSFAKKIHKPKEKIYGICLRGKSGWGENMAILGTIINSFGGQWFDMKWQAQINSIPWFKATAFYIDLLKRFGPPNVHNNGYQETVNLFANGHCGISIDATVAASTLFDSSKSKVAHYLGYAKAPIIQPHNGSRWFWTWALAIPKSSKLKKEAIEFITWATSKNYIKLVAEQTSWLAVPPGTRYSTYRNEEYNAAVPFAKFVFDAIVGRAPNDATLNLSPYQDIQYVAIPEFAAIGTEVGININQVLKGKISLNTALQKSQEFVEKKMRLAGY